MANTVKVHTKLMPTASDRMGTNKRVIIKSLNNLELGDTAFSQGHIDRDSA
jgi:hypothetical protein